MRLLLSHLAVLTLSPPALSWLRRDLLLLLHRRGRWAPAAWTAALFIFLLSRNLLPPESANDAALAAAAAACWLGREASTLPRHSRLGRSAYWLCAGFSLALLYLGGFRRFEWASMLASAFCLAAVYRDKTEKRGTSGRRMAVAAPMIWLLAEAVSGLDHGLFRYAGRLCANMFFCLRAVAAGPARRPRADESTRTAEQAGGGGSLHEIRNALASIFQLTKLAHASTDQGYRGRCLDLAGEFCEESLRTVGAAAALGSSPRHIRGFAPDRSGGLGAASGACLALLLDGTLRRAQPMGLRCLRLELDPRAGSWCATLEFAGNPLAAPILGVRLGLWLRSRPELRSRGVKMRVIALYPRSALAIEYILKD